MEESKIKDKKTRQCVLCEETNQVTDSNNHVWPSLFNECNEDVGLYPNCSHVYLVG